ncbi:unnamed protein product [Phaedon cochleariae]|uniref:Uncharacterized protein n=1 Tax=Phaedon cochleariae TaxID=80249 RepID=A0A9P0DST8_PHACE|nr:unnamed protein product [Phaedon cochleariae]
MDNLLTKIRDLQNVNQQYMNYMTDHLSNLHDEVSRMIKTASPPVANRIANTRTRSVNLRRPQLHQETTINNNNHIARSSSANRNMVTRRRRSAGAAAGGPTQTSRKWDDFTTQPIGTKSSDRIPGIGPRAYQSLNQMNYGSARRLLGKFLECERQEFLSFLEERVGVLPHNAQKAWQCLHDYNANFL